MPRTLESRIVVPERRVRLFRNGRNQALRIPREFELDGSDAIIRKDGDRLIVEPVRKGQLLALLARLEPVDAIFPDIDEDLPPVEDVAFYAWAGEAADPNPCRSRG